jgi:ribosomal 50S subunit-recycling heat shock protein
VNRQRVTKPGYAIKGGDVITVAGAGRIRVLKVVGMGIRRGRPVEAATLYEEIAAIGRVADALPVDETGRPSKHGRRQLRDLKGKG